MITREHTVWCDFDDCGEWETFGSDTKAQASKFARRNGWKLTRKGWQCPQHEKKKRIREADAAREAELGRT